MFKAIQSRRLEDGFLFRFRRCLSAAIGLRHTVGLICLALISNGFGVSAEAASGRKDRQESQTLRIYLVDRNGNEHAIGSVVLASPPSGSEDARGQSISVRLESEKFVDKFLSMRPFKCIEGAKQTVCHLPYPYNLSDRIGPDNVADLEYRLLFLHKGPAEFGIDAWNGLYYRLKPEGDGGFTGTLHEADFNILAVPPEDGVTRPIKPADLTEAEVGRHRFPELVIR